MRTMEHDGTKCDTCDTGEYFWSWGCGAYVCWNIDCEQHRGLCRCYCGWAQDGYAPMNSEGELLEDY